MILLAVSRKDLPAVRHEPGHTCSAYPGDILWWGCARWGCDKISPEWWTYSAKNGKSYCLDHRRLRDRLFRRHR